MNTVQVKNTVIGEGRPKICVPIVGKTKTDILEEAKKITTLPVDVVEWRVDWFDDVFATEKVLETAKELQEVLKDIPVLLTFRTSKEGGEKEISVNDYAALNIAAAQSGYVDLIDVEAFTGDEVVKTIINAAHEAGVKVIASNHDFFKTPSENEILSILKQMEEAGADIAKIAVMPTCTEDVLTLLSATCKAKKELSCPVITMSMAKAGLISRLSGEVFGSCLTFGAAGNVSAPGQINALKLRSVLEILHENS